MPPKKKKGCKIEDWLAAGILIAQLQNMRIDFIHADIADPHYETQADKVENLIRFKDGRHY